MIIEGRAALDAKLADESVILHKYADPTEGSRGDLSIDDAEEIGAEDWSLLWAEVAPL